jgi:V/A-type H+-transporting ATPase subunit I
MHLALFKYFSIASICAILLFSSRSKNLVSRIGIGLYELYGITKYFSDVLSYSRLLALGMATGVIAMVVNLLARSSLHIPFIGFIVALLIFLGGHTFNIAINLMSGFIHSARLQFVEFFSKFFTLGSSFFEPFTYKTKYIGLTDNVVKEKYS